MIEIYGPAASRTRRALWTAEEAGVPYVHKPIRLRDGEHLRPEYVALNPNARVPTLVDGDLVLFESAAICLYLARKDPARRLLPARDSREEALHDQWLTWVVCELEQPLWTLGKHRFALPEEHRLPAIAPTARFEWDRAERVLADALRGRPFLVGESLTVADLMAAHTLNWARSAQMPMDDVLGAYLDRLLALPSWARVRDLP